LACVYNFLETRITGGESSNPPPNFRYHTTHSDLHLKRAMLTIWSVALAYRPAFIKDIHWAEDLTEWLDERSQLFEE
jgi:hypothetical protein